LIRNDEFKPDDVLNVDGIWDHAQESIEKEEIQYENKKFFSKTLFDVTKEILLNPRLGSLMTYVDGDITIADWNSGSKFKENIIQDIVFYDDTFLHFGAIEMFVTLNGALFCKVNGSNVSIQNITHKNPHIKLLTGVYIGQSPTAIFISLYVFPISLMTMVGPIRAHITQSQGVITNVLMCH
jgi:hypothetical protein